MLLHQITLKNLLSFGPNTKPLDLRPLNVLIGPNGSGKSNLIEGIRLLQSAPLDLFEGTNRDWLWQGIGKYGFSVEMALVVRVEVNGQELEHALAFDSVCDSLLPGDEIIKTVSGEPKNEWQFDIANHCINFTSGDETTPIELGDIRLGSMLASFRATSDPLHVPLMRLAAKYDAIRIYRDCWTGRSSPVRSLERFDLRNSSGPREGSFRNRSVYGIKQNFSNLASVLEAFDSTPEARQRVRKALCEFSASLSDFEVRRVGDYLELRLIDGEFSIPATRLSDGTLRYLCLIAILCDPKPPPLICLEEPELGLHPDVIPTIAELLKEASERTQIIVTTHSDTLVDCFTSSPEDVVVCEKHDGQTEMTRLDGERLSQWLKEYSLGTLWSQGEIGGNRW